jgi:hypothetical protein
MACKYCDNLCPNLEKLSIQELFDLAKKSQHDFIHDRIMAEFRSRLLNVNTYPSEEKCEEKEKLRKMLPPNQANGDDDTSYNLFHVEAHILIEHIDKMYKIGFKFGCYCDKCDEFRDESDINPTDGFESGDDEGDDDGDCQEHGTGEHHDEC